MKKQQKKQLNQVQNQAQEGRSMVEMLGVLAIVGVLSIGGIAGYSWGMDKHVANQILYEMNLNSAQLAMLLQKGNPEGVTLSLGSPYDEGKFRTVDYGFEYACGDKANSGHDCKFIDETMYSMTATGLPKRVCNMLSDAAASLTYASELEINGGDNECNDTGNTVTVFFDTDTTVEGGIPRPEESVTDPNPDDRPTECPGNTWLSADESECTCSEDEKTCNGGCCAGCEGGKVWNGKKCVCPTGAEPGEDGEGCACKTATPYWNGTKCTTCPEGSQPLNGKCVCNNDTSKEWKASAEDGACEKELFGECESNADCGPGEYCYLYWGNSCSNEFDSNKFGLGYNNNKGECRNARGDANPGKKTHFVGSNSKMTWWSAERFCTALGRRQATRNTVRCGINPDDSSCIDTDGMLTNLRADFDSDSYMWLADEDENNSCNAYGVTLYRGDVGGYNRFDTIYALCE